MGSLPAVFMHRIQRANMNVHLSFVVGRAAAEQIAAADGRLKGRRGPQIQRLGRLHVVVPVEKNGRLARRVQRFAVNERMHFRGNDFDIVEARAAQAFGHPFRGALDVRLVLGLRADAGNPQKFIEIVQVLVALGIDVSRRFMRRSLAE